MNNIYSFLKNACLKTNSNKEVSPCIVVLLGVVLSFILLPFIFGSISCILFVLLFIILEKNKRFQFNIALFFPILYFILILTSLLWSINLKESKASVQTAVLFFSIPLCFLFFKKITKAQVYKIVEIHGFFMVGYAILKIAMACKNYLITKNTNVFFYHELVSLDVNAIYVAAFASLSLFYFLQLNKKNSFQQFSVAVLAVFIFLLSSKSIIFIDFILVIYFYIKHAQINKGVKIVTIFGIFVFVFSSLAFVKQIRERFMLEYETAFVDNTVNNKISEKNATVYNISLRQAWSNQVFREDNFFPGTALRVYQFRIFCEIISENKAIFTGFGHNAVQSKIKEKEKQYHLYSGYGDFNFHNQYTQTFSELGLLGFLLLVSMIVINLRNAFRSKDFLHIVFAVTVLILFVTESMLCRQRGIVFFITLYCIFNILNQKSNKVTTSL